ncbi:MAG: peptide chain release factor N(5)-glutamine methyltransferase [Treponemataceae bacterium]|nr:peptide chain release factor N(5)-glutamine methyltransferase [Treponemataceae bacterium]
MTISDFRHEKANFLENSPTPLLDIDCILMHFLNKDKTWIFTHSDSQIDEVADENLLSQIESAVQKRKTGFPVAYITEKKEFYGIDFYVNKNVLIPKPDTEILVEKAIELINANSFKTCADICTGSGCIAIATAKNVSDDVVFFATDVSHLCLEVAQKNADEILGEDSKRRIQFFLGEVLWPLIENENQKINEQKLDIILSNPPYIPRIMVNDLLRDGRNEPILALDGDACYIDTRDPNYGDGLSVIRVLVSQSFDKLKNGGYFLCETGEYNSQDTVELCRDAGFSEIQVLKDLEGAPRVVMAQKL